MDSNILDHLGAMVIRPISTEEEKIDLISLVPSKFRKWVHIMMKKAAAKVPQHKPYDHGIDITDSETPLWWPSKRSLRKTYEYYKTGSRRCSSQAK
jgi:hypothetical protein